MSKAKQFKRSFLIFVFFYLISMMLVMGNGHSFLGYYLSGYFIPVANSIGLNTTWNFFSPDPANTMYFRYDVIFEDDYGQVTADSVEEFYPVSRELGGDFRLDQRRFSYAMRWLAVDSDRIRQFFVPKICREHPKAKKIQVQLILKAIPPLEKVITLQNEAYEDLTQTEIIGNSTYECS